MQRSVSRILNKGDVIEVDRRIAIREFASYLPITGMSKLFVGKHGIDREKCTKCGVCEKRCPSDAISPSFQEVKSNKCVLCFGCFNNCPEQAVTMTLAGKQLYNFPEFLKRNKIVVREPEELI